MSLDHQNIGQAGGDIQAHVPSTPLTGNQPQPKPELKQPQQNPETPAKRKRAPSLRHDRAMSKWSLSESAWKHRPRLKLRPLPPNATARDIFNQLAKYRKHMKLCICCGAAHMRDVELIMDQQKSDIPPVCPKCIDQWIVCTQYCIGVMSPTAKAPPPARVTRADNVPSGASHWRTKGTEEQAKKVLLMKRQGKSVKETASETGLSVDTIKKIRSGRTWKHLLQPGPTMTAPIQSTHEIREEVHAEAEAKYQANLAEQKRKEDEFVATLPKYTPEQLEKVVEKTMARLNAQRDESNRERLAAMKKAEEEHRKANGFLYHAFKKDVAYITRQASEQFSVALQQRQQAILMRLAIENEDPIEVNFPTLGTVGINLGIIKKPFVATAHILTNPWEMAKQIRYEQWKEDFDARAKKEIARLSVEEVHANFARLPVERQEWLRSDEALAQAVEEQRAADEAHYRRLRNQSRKNKKSGGGEW